MGEFWRKAEVCDKVSVDCFLSGENSLTLDIINFIEFIIGFIYYMI